MARVLIVDSDDAFRRDMEADLGRRGFDAHGCATRSEAVRHLELKPCDVVLLADDLPEGDMLANLTRLVRCESAPEVVVLSGSNDQDLAEQSIRAGAWNFFTKPPSLQLLSIVIERIEKQRRTKRPARAVALKRGAIIGSSKALQSALNQVAQASGGRANVLITGETGTGKELFARAVHENSPRSKRPFVIVDCAALPSSLAESILFGHEKGAFTSADARSEGLIAQAHSGTLFLDEVGELPMGVQKVFLRVLEARCYRPVGSTREHLSDFRLVAATNRNLEDMARREEFRSDLLFRLQGFSLELPPLRLITDDINELTCHYIGRLCSSLGIPRKGFSPDFLECLMHYNWPGNTRELFHAIEQAVSMAEGEAILFPRHLPTYIRAFVARAEVGREHPDEEAKDVRCPVPEGNPEEMEFIRDARARMLAAFETNYLSDLMRRTQRDMDKACRVSGLSRARLYALLKERGISR